MIRSTAYNLHVKQIATPVEYIDWRSFAARECSSVMLGTRDELQSGRDRGEALQKVLIKKLGRTAEEVASTFCPYVVSFMWGLCIDSFPKLCLPSSAEYCQLKLILPFRSSFLSHWQWPMQRSAREIRKMSIIRKIREMRKTCKMQTMRNHTRRRLPLIHKVLRANF